MEYTGIDVLENLIERSDASEESIHAFRTILDRLFQEFERSNDLGLCAIFGDAIKDAAGNIRYEEKEWQYQGRYNEALFWSRYLRKEGRDSFGVYVDLQTMVLARHENVDEALYLLYEIRELGRSYEYSCHWHMRHAGEDL